MVGKMPAVMMARLWKSKWRHGMVGTSNKTTTLMINVMTTGKFSSSIGIWEFGVWYWEKLSKRHEVPLSPQEGHSSRHI